MIDSRYMGIPTQNQFQRPYELIRVNGKNGAQAFSMPPNSSVLLLDNTAPVVWLKTTDGASYPSIMGYTIEPLIEEPEISKDSYTELECRIKKLEGIIDGLKSDNTSVKQRNKPQQS